MIERHPEITHVYPSTAAGALHKVIDLAPLERPAVRLANVLAPADRLLSRLPTISLLMLVIGISTMINASPPARCSSTRTAPSGIENLP